MAKAVVNLYPTIELDEGGTADLAEMFRLLGDGTLIERTLPVGVDSL